MTTPSQCILTPNFRIGIDYEALAAFQNLVYGPTFQFPPQGVQSPYTFGTGAGQCDRLYTATGSIAASGTLTIVLTGFTDPLNETVSMLRFKTLWVANLVVSGVTPASQLNVGNAPTHPLANWISSVTATMPVRAGGLLQLWAGQDATGFPIVASTSDQLLITNADSVNAGNYAILIGGCSA